MVPYNLLTDSGYAAYVNTGVWASKAIKEAKIIGNTKVIASSEDKTSHTFQRDTKSQRCRLFTYHIKQYNLWNSNEEFPKSDIR